MNEKISISGKIKTVLALGIVNLLRIIRYRYGIRLGVSKIIRLKELSPKGLFFRLSYLDSATCIPSTNWKQKAKLFSNIEISVSDKAPDWYMNYNNGKRKDNSNLEWWKIPDFDDAVGDIKNVWELSRFDWVLAYAQNARMKDEQALLRINLWINDWSEKNKPYFGPNWKCGQEVSIRVMNLALAALLLEQTKASEKPLLDLIKIKMRRIEPTIGYALAQNNNHGTSEAAALYIGGSWLMMNGDYKAQRWEEKGRRIIENRVKRLIENDGSFSQYSVNYHRFMLDTLCIAELWRIKHDLKRFSDVFYLKAAAAAKWLATIVDSETGDAPNIGANDGARLIQLTNTNYRDYRPSVQLSMALFTGQKYYHDKGSWDDTLSCLGISVSDRYELKNNSKIYDDGGYGVLKRKSTMAVLRYPRFRYRPSHSDALHLDLWRKGENILRDSGSYSYNSKRKWQEYFPGTESHNTIQFDDRDQMPRIGRFLYGEWLKTEKIYKLREEKEETIFGAAYTDWCGAYHKRIIKLADRSIVIIDEISGFKEKAVLRWRLKPGLWVYDNDTITDNEYRIVVTSSEFCVRKELCTGWESRLYTQKTELPVYEIEVKKAGELKTVISW